MDQLTKFVHFHPQNRSAVVTMTQKCRPCFCSLLPASKTRVLWVSWALLSAVPPCPPPQRQGSGWTELWQGCPPLSVFTGHAKPSSAPAPSQQRGNAIQHTSSLPRGMVSKFIMCQMYIIKTYYSQAKCSYSIWEYYILACLIDLSIDCMLALQTAPWPEVISQPLQKAEERSSSSLL